MTESKSALFLNLICLLLCSFGLSCSNSNSVVPPLFITPTAVPPAFINTSYSLTLAVTGGKAPYTWALASGTLPAGLNISASGVISGTPTAVGTTAFKVQVTDSQTSTPAANTALTITVNASSLAITTTSLPSGAVGVPFDAPLTATGGVQPYTWTLSAGSLPVGLAVNASGSIIGTPLALGAPAITLQVSDSESPALTANMPLTVTVIPPSVSLNGSYVFSFSGYQNGQPVVQAGGFTADGSGNITNGLMDSNGPAGVQPKLTFSGTYTLNGTNSGIMTLTVPGLGTFSYQIAVPPKGTIRVTQSGGAGNQGTGVIRPVNTTAAISVNALVGYWSFGGTGVDSASNRYAGVGTFQASSSGAWSGGVEDTNDNGTVAANQSFTGGFLGFDSTTGRGTAKLTANSVTTNYSIYPISATELIMVGIDPLSANAPLGVFDLTARPINMFPNGALTGTKVVALQGGGSTPSNPAPYGLLSFMTFSVGGNVTISTDENLGGTLSTNSYSATYSTAPNGRTTVTGFGTHPFVFYIADTVAYALEGDPSVSYGTIEPQFGAPFAKSSISGPYLGGTVQAVGPQVSVQTDSASSDGLGNLSLVFTTSGPGGPQPYATERFTYSVDSTGHATLMLNGSTAGIGYVVSGYGNLVANPKIYLLSTDASADIVALER